MRLVYYRLFERDPDVDMTAPSREELVRVSIAAARTLLDRLKKKRQSLGDGERDRERKRWLRPWSWNPLSKTPWTVPTSVHPGQVLLLHSAAGGYDPDLGWTGDVLPKHAVRPVLSDPPAPTLRELMDSDRRTAIARWITLRQHLEDVGNEASTLVSSLGIADHLKSAVVVAAVWHDVGKAHAEFQRRIVEPVRDDPELRSPGDGPWAKSAHNRRPPPDSRPYFRHELASALFWLQSSPDHPERDLVAYLIAAHHGKVRLSIRSVPGEALPDEPDKLFARGVWHGDVLPAFELPDGRSVGPLELDLSLMLLGAGSWLERTLALRDDAMLGPFRLSYLEGLVRIADWRASEKERLNA